MANLAIRGHSTKGKEVIEILEMLGGSNIYRIDAIRENCVYFIIDDKNKTISSLKLNQVCPEQFVIFTLEEFLEKFPYKVGDRVKKANDDGGYGATIISMDWNSGTNEVVYTIILDDHIGSTLECLSINLQPYEEETFGECIAKTIDICLFGEQKTMEEQIKIDIPEGYKFSGIDNQQVVFEKVKPKYPKDFEECCSILEVNVDAYFDHEDPYSNDYEFGLEKKLLCLRKLLICRGAYWKLAGEQMGLDKPWEPDYTEESWEQGCPSKYVIYFNGICIVKERKCTPNHILSFPTEEMRDIFYENFGYLIEICKEFL